MALRKILEEEYYSNSVKIDKRNFGVNPVIKKIEKKLGGACFFSEMRNSRGRRAIGRVGKFERYHNAKVGSDSDEIILNLTSHYENPAARFIGEVELTMRYLKGTNDKDLERIRKAILNSGLKKK